MKKIILASFITILLTSCALAKKTTTEVPVNILANDVDSMSYALGINVGSGFANDLKNIPGGRSNIDLVIKGFTQAMKGDLTLLNSEEAQTFLRDYLTKAQKIENEAHKAKGEKFLAENKLKSGIQVTSSGLQYEIISSANGKKPIASDRVKVHYIGKTIDGNVFDSSVERGEPVEFGLNQVIPGWSEGVQLMTVGSKYKFFIPYNLAYGEQGIPQANIPPFSPLIFEVELIEIIKQEEPKSTLEEVKSE
ncbi:MAG: FKBP-type peptidyl-prolyl cis-trans isomerase [Bacteroidales bacterium]|nr:FKBP-type peptidyl-prolyl cis-trans isomerase [Bacteroidales bacterium]